MAQNSNNKSGKKGSYNNGRKYDNRNRGRKSVSDAVHDRDRGVKTQVDESKDVYNDPSWYKLNDQIAKDVASFSFGTATGSAVTLSTGNSYQAAWVNSIPGTYSIYTIPAIGRALSETDPINIAMASLFRNLRKGNTGSQVYDMPDLIMYLIAVDSAYSWYAVLNRLYGLARTYSYYNRYYADGITLAQNFDPSVLNNLAWLRGFINQLSVKLNQFAVPNSIHFFKRHYWMYSNIFRDGPTPKAQVYLYVPQALYVYDELSGAGMCKLIDICGTINASNAAVPRTPLTEQNIINITNNILDPLVKSQDVNIISGDIVKFWGDQLYQLKGINDDYSIVPAYEMEVLDQIHNTTYVGNGILASASISSAFGYDSATIQQMPGVNQGYIYCSPAFKGANAASYSKLLDFANIESPSPDNILVASRNMSVWSQTYDTTNDDYMFTPYAHGSEIFMYHVIGRYNPQAQQFVYSVEPCRNPLTEPNSLAYMARVCYFDHAPLFYRTGAAAYHHLLAVLGDIENYRVMSGEDLGIIHQGAILAMFALKDSIA